MISKKGIPVDVDEYIARFPANTQKLLKQLRATILKKAPGAEEMISYQMPYYKYKGRLLYFAAYEDTSVFIQWRPE
jgi:uncharacterized protein YdhG (YjbR/CyaY superfamily)